MLFRQLGAVKVVHNISICRNFEVGGKGKVYRNHAAHIVVLMVAKRLNQGAAVWFVDDALTTIWTQIWYILS